MKQSPRDFLKVARAIGALAGKHHEGLRSALIGYDPNRKLLTPRPMHQERRENSRAVQDSLLVGGPSRRVPLPGHMSSQQGDDLALRKLGPHRWRRENLTELELVAHVLNPNWPVIQCRNSVATSDDNSYIK